MTETILGFRVHPAADAFPLLEGDNLRQLADDIEQHGLRQRIVLWRAEAKTNTYLLDGRNRLAAMKLAGVEPRDGDFVYVNGDPVAYALSANAHRRHLTPEQKRQAVEALLKADPSKSDRAIAKAAKADHKTVGKVRADLEATGDVPRLQERKGEDGKTRKQPVRKPSVAEPAEAVAAGHAKREDGPIEDADWDPVADAPFTAKEVAEHVERTIRLLDSFAEGLGSSLLAEAVQDGRAKLTDKQEAAIHEAVERLEETLGCFSDVISGAELT